MEINSTKYCYRYIDGQFGTVLRKYPVVKDTTFTYVIKDVYCNRNRRVYKSAYTSYAKDSIAKAKASYVRRKQKEVQILEKRIARAKEGLFEAELGNFSSFLKFNF